MISQFRIGILGGGQLAKMSALQAIRMGLNVSILEKFKNSPAGQLTRSEFIGWVDDKQILKEFCDASDIITLENEFIDHSYLNYIESLGKKVIPSSHTISLIQDKLLQKKTLVKRNIPVPDFFDIRENTGYVSVKKLLGKKFVIKSRKMGYDGYGNSTVSTEGEYNSAVSKLKSRHSELYAEEFIPFKKELAVMVARTRRQIRTYPVVETIQKDHICHTVIAPADIPDNVRSNALEIAIESVRAVKGFGLFGIELFLTKDDKILVNEMAPRPHNSGHYTIEASVTSQFENHIRSVMDLPLGSPDMIKPAAVMINLLGKKNSPGLLTNLNNAFKDDHIKIHIYGKAQSRVGRKMGHITLLGEDVPSILKRAQSLEKKIFL